jgi:PAS domain S-box-containing protein
MLSRKIDAFHDRVRGLARQAGQASEVAPSLVLQELETAVEELHAAESELMAQAEALQQAQVDIERERQRYVSLFEFAPDGYLVTDAAASIREANQAAAQMLGVPPRRLVHKPLVSYIAPERRTEFRSLLNRLAPSMKVVHWEGAVKPRNAAPVPVDFRVAVDCDPATGQVNELHWGLRDISATKALQAEQEQLLASLRELATRLEAVREHEQARLARQVHDEIGGRLTAVKIVVTQVRGKLPDSPEVADLHARLDDAAAQLDLIAETARNIAAELRPAVLDRLGLVAAVSWHLEQFEERTGLACNLRVTPGDTPCPRPVADAVFRVFQELLTNVARHAQAARVEVRLAQVEGNLVLEVRDNGRGIDPHAASAVTSLGLLGSRERLRDVDGTLELHGSPGLGTLARVTVPLPAAGEGRK